MYSFCLRNGRSPDSQERRRKAGGWSSFFNVIGLLCSLLQLQSCSSILENRSGQYVWEDHSPRSGIWKGTNGGEVISFSGCDDDQTSADTAVSS